MRQSITTTLLAVLMSMVGLKSVAHDIEALNNDGVTIYYIWANDAKTQLAVSCRGLNNYSYDDEYTGTVVIPKSVNYNGNTYPVTSIDSYAFYGCSGLTSVTIPNSVTTIGYRAFYYCSGLTSVTIPNSVTFIGGYAFCGCSGLTSVTIPNSVGYIGVSAFSSSGLTSVTIPNSVTYIEDYVFSYCSGLTSVTIPNSVTSIGSDAFRSCSGLTSVTIPNSVTSIGESAFDGCSGLTSVTIGNSVTSIEFGTFTDCSGLTSVTIPNSVTSINNYAFHGCSDLTSIIVEGGNKNYDSRNNCNAIIEKSSNSLIFGCKNTTIPNSVTSIGSYAFEGCSGLTSVTIPNNVTSIGSSAFNGCSGLTSVIIPNSVTSIGNWAFAHCSGLTSVTIGNSVTSIENGAFYGCSGLTSVTIPNSVTSIGSSAFYDCSDLISVTIPNSVTSIGSSAFSGCSGLTSVTIPNSVTSIGSSAFYDCSGLTSVTIPNSVTSIGYSAFQNCSSLTSVTIPNSVTSIGSSVFLGCSGLTSIIVEGGNKNYDSRNNCNAIIEKSSNGLIFGCKNTTIPNSVTSIGNGAFYNCGGLTSVTIPNSVTSIGESAFRSCSGLTSVTIGNCMTSIGESAFEGCSSLTSVTIPNSVTSIGKFAFKECWRLKSIYSELETPIQIAYINEDWDSMHDVGYFYSFSDNIFRNAILYVPKDTRSTYLATEGWNKFANIVEAGEVGSIFEVDGIYYKVGENNTVSVISGSRKYSGEVVIPSHITYGGTTYSVTSIGAYTFDGGSDITYLSIPYSIKSIGEYAFRGCGSSMTVNIADLKSWCNMKLGNEHASPLSSAGKMLVNNVETTSLDIPETVTTINAFTFYQCSCITSLNIPGTVTSIKSSAFEDCDYLTSLTLNEGLQSIGGSAFEGCKSLSTLTIPGTVNTIKVNAFKNCSALTYIISEIENPFEINNNVFNGIPSNARLRVPKGKKSAYQSTAGWNQFTNIVEVGGVGYNFDVDGIYYKIGQNNTVSVISGRKEYSGDVVIPSQVTYSGTTYNVTSIGDNAFYYCYRLTSVTFPNSMTSIGMMAFAGCEALTSITIPNSVTSIGFEAFACSSLTSITSEIEDPFSIGLSTFDEIGPNPQLIVPKGKKSIYQATAGWNQFTNIVEVGGVGYKFEADGIYYKIGENNTVSVTYGDTKYSGDVVIPSQVVYEGKTYSVTSIGVMAFYECSELTSITIPNSVKSIDDEAFSYSGITSVIIPESVWGIGWRAFCGCGLTSITFLGSVWIDKEAFMNCGALNAVHISDLESFLKNEYEESYEESNPLEYAHHLYLNGVEIKDLVIPNTITEIRHHAFYECRSLTSVTIPNSVTSIDECAFGGCSGLTSVVIGNGVKHILYSYAFLNCENLKEMILSQAAYENGIPESVTKFTTYSKDPMRVVVTSKGATSATMKIYPIDDSGNTNVDKCYTVTMLGLTPGQYIKWKLDDENYGIISEKTSALTLTTQPAQPTSTTKARFTVTLNEADDDQHFGFEWLRNDAPSNMPPSKVSAPLYEGKIMGTLSGLNPDIYYKYRPFYQSDSGETYYGEWIAFLTGDANVFFEPETHTKEATDVTDVSAQLAGVWIEGTEDTEEKGFEYWTVSKASTRAVGSDAKTVAVSGNQTTITIDNLEAGKEYGYRTYMKTASGTTYGEEKTFKTILMGDVNDDGDVNEADVDDVASHIMGHSPTGFNKEKADMNHDGEVNAVDLVEIVKIVNSKK